jgi:hypothetical protein
VLATSSRMVARAANGTDATSTWVGNAARGGAAPAILRGVGPGVTLQALIADGALKI